MLAQRHIFFVEATLTMELPKRHAAAASPSGQPARATVTLGHLQCRSLESAIAQIAHFSALAPLTECPLTCTHLMNLKAGKKIMAAA